ncbi:asparaginase [Shimia ponticola]|uniref:asparaginase n=1 Tax=Shimia ponticola TaxID=2582893 RepID=UPI0011BE7D8B|nr:asparaginase [Shimia ponticola]
MDIGAPLIELTRGGRVESVHYGHIAVCNAAGEVIAGAGDPTQIIYPRSSAKMIQAVPLALRFPDTDTERLALACASHSGEVRHTTRVERWLSELGLGETDLRCGAPEPLGKGARKELIRQGKTPCQLHSDCSGKHAGFLTVTRDLGADMEYLEIDHPVQVAVKEHFEDLTDEASPGWGIDGCSAPNHATSVQGLARAMAAFANADDSTARGRAMLSLRQAMIKHPDMVAGAGRACTELMRAAPGVALKTGAEAVFVGILPEKGLGVALKIADGSVRAAEAAIAHVLVQLGLLDPAHPDALKRVGAPLRNFRDLPVGETRAAFSLN